MSDKFQPFTVGDWYNRQSQPRTSNPKQEDDVKFEKTYPAFQRYLTTENFGELFEKCYKSCTELDRIVRTGSNEMATQAQNAINAYGLSIQLAKELLELKAKFRGW
ncbi:MAG: hypothetical protein HY819_16605 [Acidobacteria bacterium]|nr:hypothetical protein [Acidobacteriota bacterium]